MAVMPKPASPSHGVPGTAPRHTLLFRAVHGSHLYGLSHEGSDRDWYEVWDTLGGKSASQTLAGDEDTLRVDLPTFMAHAFDGVPQAVEARYAPDWAVEYETEWFGVLRRAMVPGTAAVATRYARTIMAFERNKPTPKRLRHAARYAHDRDYFIRQGWMDVTAFSRTPAADLNLYTDPATTSTKELHHA